MRFIFDNCQLTTGHGWIYEFEVFGDSGGGLPLASQAIFGGAGDQAGHAIVATNGGIYFSGTTANGTQGLVGQYQLTLGPAPTWSRTWGGGQNDYFNGVSATANGVYTVGSSFNFTTDTVGDKENKGITVRFNADGAAGLGVAGAVWSRQTPAPPGGFPYGGGEWLTGLSTANESGQTYLYAVGVGERTGFTANYGTFLTKLDESGNIFWSRNDFTFTNYTNRAAVAATGSGVVVATRSDNSGQHPYLKFYDVSGNLIWSRTSGISGEYLGIATASNKIFAVGKSVVTATDSDFLLESWDSAGNLLWSKTYDRNSAEDILNGVTAFNGHLYAIGSTRGNAVGGRDAIVLDVDLSTGTLLSSSLWGGAGDDSFTGVTISGSKLFAVGSTTSPPANGSDVLIVSWQLPSVTNEAPIANAGASQQVAVREHVTLDGRASYDPEGQPITARWSFVSRPAGSAAQLTSADTLQPSFVPDLAGQYKVRLDVSDPQLASASALVTITASANRPPVAVIAPVAGTIFVPREMVLDGRASSDPDGDPISFSWRFVSKPAASTKSLLANVRSPTPTLVLDVGGDYVIELTVWDIKEASGKAQIKITGQAVSPPPPPPPPRPVTCNRSSGASGDFYVCNGKQITQTARTAVMPPDREDILDLFTLRDGDSVATWFFGENTGLILGFWGRIAYYANCTRNPSAMPTQITDLVFPPYRIENLKIVGRTVTANVCNVVGASCYPMMPRLLPVCPTR